jgi:hypothetical protein
LPRAPLPPRLRSSGWATFTFLIARESSRGLYAALLRTQLRLENDVLRRRLHDNSAISKAANADSTSDGA